jgi:hypothetical protein
MNTNHRHFSIQTKQKENCNSHIVLFQSRFIKNARIELPLGIMEFPVSRNDIPVVGKCLRLSVTSIIQVSVWRVKGQVQCYVILIC